MAMSDVPYKLQFRLVGPLGKTSILYFLKELGESSFHHKNHKHFFLNQVRQVSTSRGLQCKLNEEACGNKSFFSQQTRKYNPL